MNIEKYLLQEKKISEFLQFSGFGKVHTFKKRDLMICGPWKGAGLIDSSFKNKNLNFNFGIYKKVK